MTTPTPHPRSPLAGLFAAPGKFDFFQAVRLLERLAATDGRAKNGTAASINDMANGGNAPDKGMVLDWGREQADDIRKTNSDLAQQRASGQGQ